METFSPDSQDVKRALRTILAYLGENPDREGLAGTPDRIIRMWEEIFRGYKPERKPRITTFENDTHDEELVFDSGDYYSMCEHHMLPFYGKVHVAYIPNGYITGLSKIARVVDVFSHRLQVQERMTLQIKECIQKTLNPLGVMVVVEAKHMCMQMRGVEKQNSITTTSDFTGAFNQAKTREEFMNLIKHN